MVVRWGSAAALYGAGFVTGREAFTTLPGAHGRRDGLAWRGTVEVMCGGVHV